MMSEFRRRLMMVAALEQQPQPPQGKYIKFEDKEVERICMANFSSDGIGVSYEDAEKVKRIGTLFKGNEKIISFQELAYFKNVTYLTNTAFLGCKNLQCINFDNIKDLGYWCFSGCVNLKVNLSIPKLLYLSGGGDHIFNNTGIISVEDMGLIRATGRYMFSNCHNLKKAVLTDTLYSGISENTFENDVALETIICKSINPPYLYPSALNNTPSLANIYVPDESVTAYKVAENWSTYADKIKPLSTYVEPTK